ncbi:hypothetical protein [Arthrobacter sp. MYb213]|uniref:hypothetical protein n=1 Tax=Arthrobacter sp. MYb213 TaxID=1848595 RepID=UPI000CFB13ED|nr:hypothetical protein [Arthrobacter sp. MYb213]PRB69502.1 hypothetical protein CQ011_12125 [Arthrobacter sp. MYb213]
MSKLSKHITTAMLALGAIAGGFLGGVIYQDTTNPPPASCLTAMDWTDSAVRIAGEAWVDGKDVPESFQHHIAEQYQAAEDCRAGR